MHTHTHTYTHNAQIRFTSTNGEVASKGAWVRRYPTTVGLSSVPPRSYDAAGASISYDLTAITQVCMCTCMCISCMYVCMVTLPRVTMLQEPLYYMIGLLLHRCVCVYVCHVCMYVCMYVHACLHGYGSHHFI